MYAREQPRWARDDEPPPTFDELDERTQRHLVADLVEGDTRYFDDAITDLDAKQCLPMIRDGNYLALGKLLADLVTKQCKREVDERLERGDFLP